MPKNYAVPLPTFQPSMRLIAAITTSNPAHVTTTFPHQYVTGTIVRLDVPAACGMPQINGQTGTIAVTGDTTFTISIDSTLYQSFVIPLVTLPQVNTAAQVVPIGEDTAILSAAVQNVLPYRAT